MLGADLRAVTARASAAPDAAPFPRAAAGPGAGRVNEPGNGPRNGPGTGPGNGRGVRRAAGGGAALLLSLGALAAGTSGAAAVEWIVGGSVSQRVEADSNPDLVEDGEAVYGATTALGLDFTALTPTTQWQVETGLSGGIFGGPGDTEDLTRLDPNFAAAVAHNGKYVDSGASFAFDMQPASFAQFEETGVTEGDATQVSVRLAADAAYALDPRNRLSLGGSGRVIRFRGGTTELEPTTSYGANLAWIHDVSPATQTSLVLGVSRFTAESDENPESLTFSLSAGLGQLVNRRLSFDASLGVSATSTERTRFGERRSEFDLGALGGLEVAWAPAPDTQLVLALSHGLEPSSLGELQTTTALGVGLQHAINRWTSAELDLLVQRQSSDTDDGGFEGDGERRTLASIGPSIAFSLSPDWALRAGYSLALEREEDEDALSNRVFLTLTHQFDILP
jgi:hypothetical protein